MNNPSVIPAFDFREMVQAKNGEVVTTSRKVAEYFGKRHGDVLRKIEQVKADCSNEFSRRNFASADYIDEQGKLRPMYSLTKDGWIMVVMGFTGKAAAAIKESYISALNWMSDQLSRRLAMGEEMQHRYAIKETRSKLKGTIGSRLMNERKKEKRVLALEHEHIMQVTQPELLMG
ncbi:Rha family transcriptional regulator [Salmonella enterica subsp. enterica serovar Weltevreden]|nr:Rha family transcriptional regulator [Salmonella enterica subsp. enterica serovar Weltevreden]